MRRIRAAATATALLLALASPLPARPVRIDGPEGPLEGELLHPRGARAGLVLIPGSGPTDRNGNGPAGLRSDTYRLLAEALAAEGLASLRIDKRGLFGSAAAIPDPEAVTVSGYAADAAAWARELAARTGLGCVWLAGHSEGGLVALAAAWKPASEAPLCGLVRLAAPGRRLSDILREQVASNPATAPFLDETSRILAALERGKRVPPESIGPARRPAYRASIQPYLIDLFSHDPAALAAAYPGPVLVIQGALDLQVTPGDARRLAGAAPGATLRLFPRMTHMLKEDVPASPFATYTDPALPLSPGLAEAIAAFVR